MAGYKQKEQRLMACSKNNRDEGQENGVSAQLNNQILKVRG